MANWLSIECSAPCQGPFWHQAAVLPGCQQITSHLLEQVRQWRKQRVGETGRGMLVKLGRETEEEVSGRLWEVEDSWCRSEETHCKAWRPTQV